MGYRVQPRPRPAQTAAGIGLALVLVSATGGAAHAARPFYELSDAEAARLFEILHTLARSPGVVFSRDELMDRVWGYRDYAGGRVVDSHVARIRRKLGDEAAEPRYIRTVHWVGYTFREAARGSAPESTE